jgi:hypothetical protein
MSIDDFRRQRSVDLVVGGSYALPRWYDCEGRLRTFACRTKRISPFRMIVDAPVVGKLGDQVTSYFKDFGELQATISDVTQNGFLMELEMTRERRAWMSQKLSWIEKRQRQPKLRDLRSDTRFVPPVSTTILTLADGTMHRCFIIDVSCSGVAVSSGYEPSIGTPLAIGSCVGRVTRRFPTGFAVRFAEKQNNERLDRLIVRAEI